jgi:hypothetical protein
LNAAYDLHKGNEYYITGKKSELDSPGEWFYSSGNLYLYSETPPANIEAKRRKIGFQIGDHASPLDRVGLV